MRSRSVGEIREVKRITRVVEIFWNDHTGKFILQDSTETEWASMQSRDEEMAPIVEFNTMDDASKEMNKRTNPKLTVKKYVRRIAGSTDLFTKGADYLVIGYDGRDGYVLIDNFLNQTVDYKSRFKDSR
jgi:hypothetical protein